MSALPPPEGGASGHLHSLPAILETQEHCLPSDPDQTSPHDTDMSFSQALVHPQAQEADF